MLGIGAVDGMVKAEIYLVDDEMPVIAKQNIDNPEVEYQRLLSAKEIAVSQLTKIMEAAVRNLGQENGEIFDYQLLILEDNDFFDKIKEMIMNEHVNCEYALDKVAEEYIELFANMDNDYLRERSADMADLAKRLQFALQGKEMKTLSEIDEDSIVAALDLSPSQTAELNRKRVKGIILERGGISSHSVIIARSMGIPCIVGVPELLKKVIHGETAIMNGSTGEVFISPTSEQIAEFEIYQTKAAKEKQELNEYIHHESRTLDGFEVKVYANIATEKEAPDLIENGGEGVGLYRTEFLYLSGNTPPSEEMQYKVYSNIAGTLNGRPLIIRTLDAGGDKNIPYLNMPQEDNPFLGYRAIRYCLDHPEIFKPQISAILRAGIHGNVEMMIPMVTSIIELRRVKEMINEVSSELSSKGIPHGDKVRIGIMMETPAAAFMADRFAKEVDFFSIGTNDLTQYLFAADRMNRMVANLNSYFHPALLKTVRYICENAKNNGIHVDICGQAGEIPALVPIWVAMGVDNLSVSIPSIPKVRKLICNTSKANAIEIMENALSFDTAKEVEDYLKYQIC